jgi:DNA-binding NarL/FixJ family response regulator
MQRGLVIEDLPPSQEWLVRVLAEAFPSIHVTVADCLRAAHRALQNGVPDIALIDLGLPDGDGTDLVAHLNQIDPAAVSVVTTVFDDDQHLLAALRAGAHGYVLKDQPAEQVRELLLGIAAGQPPLSPSIAQRLLGFFRETGPVDDEARLTEREREVLALIAKGCTVAHVAALLGISRHTTAGYVKAIYRKLNVSTRAEATLEATRRGIVPVTPRGGGSPAV